MRGLPVVQAEGYTFQMRESCGSGGQNAQCVVYHPAARLSQTPVASQDALGRQQACRE